MALGSSSRNEMDRIADTAGGLKGGCRCLQGQLKQSLVAFLGTLLGGAISFAVNQILIKGAADRAAKKREKDDEQRRERYILQMDSRKATFDLLSCICAGIERMETETGQIYWNGELKRSLAHLEGVDERYRESDQRQLADLNTRSK